MRILETNMCDGVDLVHEFNTIEEALASGRFDYIQMNDREEYDEIIENSTTIEEFIENVGYPFYSLE